MLGLHLSQAGNSITHINHMVQKDLNWVDCLRTKPVSCSNAWLSFYFQLFPAISWGLVTVCMQPAKLNKKLQRVYKRALPFLGVNWKIKQEWRTLLEMYQGLSLPNFPLMALSEKVSFLFGNWGFHGQAPSDALAMAFQNFLVEVGLYGSPLDWNYKDYGHLATEASWFHNPWNITHLVNASLTFCTEDQVHGAREHNRSLMLKFFCVG
jgi:hypothetical protein